MLTFYRRIAMEVLTAIIDVIIAFTAGWIYLPY
jgi:hypothetical protein